MNKALVNLRFRMSCLCSRVSELPVVLWKECANFVSFHRLQSALPSSPSANQSSVSSSSPRPAQPSTNRTPPRSPARAAGAEPNGHQPITDLLGDDVSLLSTLSGPSSHDSLLSESGSGGGQQRSPAGQPGSGGGHDPAAAGDATRRAASLAEVVVRLEDVTPGERRERRTGWGGGKGYIRVT